MSDYLLQCTDVNEEPVTDEHGRFVYYNTKTGAYLVLENDHEDHSSTLVPSDDDPEQDIGDVDAMDDADQTCTQGNSSVDLDSTISNSSYDTRFTHRMTLQLIELVKAKFTLLNDKNHCKKTVWEMIALERQKKGSLNNIEKKKAGDKCHQRWRNLEKMYHGHRNYIKSTGKGKKKEPMYFGELHEVIGNRHSSEPALVLDSIKDASKEPTDSKASTSSATSLSSDQENYIDDAEDTVLQNTRCAKKYKIKDNPKADFDLSDEENCTPNDDTRKVKKIGKSVFNSIKTSVRPKKENLAEVLKELNKKDIEVQEESFRKLESYLKQQNDLKSRELDQRDAFLAMMEKFVASENTGKKIKEKETQFR